MKIDNNSNNIAILDIGKTHVKVILFDANEMEELVVYQKKNEIVNNIYAGTKNYKRKEDRATYYGNWTRQTMMCANTYPRANYYRVIQDKDSFIPDHLKDLHNFKHIELENFTKKFNNN